MGSNDSKDEWETPDVTADEVVANAKTGDIILFSGKGPDAQLIRATSVNPLWSHVGVIVKLRDQDGNYRMVISEELRVFFCDLPACLFC